MNSCSYLFSRYIATFLLVLLCTSGRAQNIDISLLRDINLHRSKSLDLLMKGISNSTYPVSAAIPVTELIYGCAHHDRQVIRLGWTTTAGLAVNGILAFGIKYAANRTRPYVTYPDLQPAFIESDPSFPSGHTSFAFYTATMLSIHTDKWYVIAPLYTWATAVGYSRLHLGVHYPTDVLAGAVVGAGSAWLTYKGSRWLQHKLRKKEKPVE